MKNINILYTIANSDRDFQDYLKDSQQDLSTQLSAQQQEELASKTLALLAQDENTKDKIALLRQTDDKAIDLGVVTSAIAIIFILRTRFKIARNEQGEWSFLAEHEPADNDLVKELLTYVKQLFD